MSMKAAANKFLVASVSDLTHTWLLFSHRIVCWRNWFAAACENHLFWPLHLFAPVVAVREECAVSGWCSISVSLQSSLHTHTPLSPHLNARLCFSASVVQQQKQQDWAEFRWIEPSKAEADLIRFVVFILWSWTLSLGSLLHTLWWSHYPLCARTKQEKQHLHQH